MKPYIIVLEALSMGFEIELGSTRYSLMDMGKGPEIQVEILGAGADGIKRIYHTQSDISLNQFIRQCESISGPDLAAIHHNVANNRILRSKMAAVKNTYLQRMEAEENRKEEENKS